MVAEQPNERICFKWVYTPNWPDRLHSKSREGRFHDSLAEAQNTLYCADSEATAWKEVLKNVPWADQAEFRLCRIRIRLPGALDLTESRVRRLLHVARRVLIEDHPPCRQLAEKMRAQGIPGFYTYSSADEPDGRCFVVFKENLTPACLCEEA